MQVIVDGQQSESARKLVPIQIGAIISFKAYHRSATGGGAVRP